MNQPHTIRLRGPWTCQFRDGDQQSAEQRYMGPQGLCQLVPTDYAGPLVLRRRFHAPPGVMNSPRVDLVIDATSPISAWLNDRLLLECAVELSRVDIASQLTPDMELRVELQVAAGVQLDKVCDAWLEIH
ncbi:MAG: hypothetical protein KDB23_08395 [Planctomycetales bacterium]|nr:hypothetical protein [Planctomycetales bacterium]